MEYPARSRFFAFRFCRLIAKICLASEIGADACYLLVTIAMVEDARGYRGPVTWFNQNLADVLGCGSVDSLDRIRKRAIGSGWLHYRPGTKGKAGTYWVKIPPQFCGGTDEADQSAGDENRPQACGGMGEIRPQISGGIETEPENTSSDLRQKAGGMCGGKPEECAEESARNVRNILPYTLYPNPEPFPAPVGGVPPTTPRRSRKKQRHAYCDAFELFWKTYPRQEAKAKANEAWIAVGRHLTQNRFQGDKNAAADFLQAKCAEYAASKQVASLPRDKIPHPATWLNAGRYDDDTKAWEVESGRATNPGGNRRSAASGYEIGPGQRYRPPDAGGQTGLDEAAPASGTGDDGTMPNLPF